MEYTGELGFNDLNERIKSLEKKNAHLVPESV